MIEIGAEDDVLILRAGRRSGSAYSEIGGGSRRQFNPRALRIACDRCVAALRCRPSVVIVEAIAKASVSLGVAPVAPALGLRKLSKTLQSGR
jgi:hypothetical protein